MLEVHVALGQMNCMPGVTCSVLPQVKFTFDEAGLHLHYPAAYTICAQGLANGSYVFPAPQGKAWLSARLQENE